MNRLNDLYRSQHNHDIEHRIERAFTDKQRFGRISIHAFYGIVELSGVARNVQTKSQAIQIAKRVPGVTTVVETIRIEERRTSIHRRTRQRRCRTSFHLRENPNAPHCQFESTGTRGRSVIEPGLSSLSPFRG